MIATLWSQELVPLSRSNRVALGGHYDLSKGSYSVLQESVESCSLKHMKRFRGLSICVTEAIGQRKQRLTRGIPCGLIERRYPWKSQAVWYNAEPSGCNTIIPLPTKYDRVIVSHWSNWMLLNISADKRTAGDLNPVDPIRSDGSRVDS